MPATRALLLATFALAAAFVALPALAMRHADFAAETPSVDARHVADWAVDSGDTKSLPFIVVDKVRSRVFVFDRGGRLLGAAPALVGSATGDKSVPGIGQRAMSTIRPEERTTPAGRFVASIERSLAGDEILWVDYDAAIALHRVIATVPKERRLQRMESRTDSEHRITYGCINVPVRFFDDVVAPVFRGKGGIVYVLPEMRPAREIFNSYDNPPPAPQPLGLATPAPG